MGKYNNLHTRWLPRRPAPASSSRRVRLRSRRPCPRDRVIARPAAAVVRAVSVPVVASGGFASGASLIAALTLGAQGIHCGTVFLTTGELEPLALFAGQVAGVIETVPSARDRIAGTVQTACEVLERLRDH